MHEGPARELIGLARMHELRPFNQGRGATDLPRNKPVDHQLRNVSDHSLVYISAAHGAKRPPDPHIIVVGTRSNLRHIVVKDGLLDAIIPFDDYARPVLFDDGALIDLIVLPANAVPTVSNRDWSCTRP